MLFNSFIFMAFLLVVIPISYAIRSGTWQKSWLLLASYVFYGYWDWRFCGLLLLSSGVDFWVGQRIAATVDARQRKRWLSLSLIVNLGLLGTFKYFNFFVDSFAALAASMGWQVDSLHLALILPVGISFYTFQTLSYSLDIYYRRLEPSSNLLDFALFVSFFPQLVAGPIERARTLLPQLKGNLRATTAQFQSGIVLIISGLFRKVMLGDTAGRYVDHLFADPEAYTAVELICGLCLFSIQIYADFSGYSRIARGTARLLGVELMQNFAEPYFSRNITEFWRRWHISLSTWLRDYLYIPLGGNRKRPMRTYLNLMITMLLGGLWHGAGWNFLIWGGLHGLYLAVHRAWRGRVDTREPIKWASFSWLTLLQVLGTYLLVSFTWLFFRAQDMSLLHVMVDKCIYWEESAFSWRFLKILGSYLLLAIGLDILAYRGGHTHWLQIKPQALRNGMLAGMFIVVCMYLLQSSPMPFIYFQF